MVNEPEHSTVADQSVAVQSAKQKKEFFLTKRTMEMINYNGDELPLCTYNRERRFRFLRAPGGILCNLLFCRNLEEIKN